MSWAEHHGVSERLAQQAETSARQTDSAGAKRAYLKAAQAEERALEDLEEWKRRTRGITMVSAVSLYHKAGEREKAARLAREYLEEPVPLFAFNQLRDLLVDIAHAESAGSESARL